MNKVTNNSVCYIVGAAEVKSLDIELNVGDILIAADGGYDRLMEFGYCPDLIIGDFDSSMELNSTKIDSSMELKSNANNSKIIALNPIKDDTDMLSAVKKGLELGYTKFKIYGGMGGRLDHTFANIQTLKYLIGLNCAVELIGDTQIITALKNSTITIPVRTGYLSVFSLTDKSTVTLRSLKYLLNKYSMTDEFPIGISNEFVGTDATITVEDGTVIIMYDKINN